VLVDRVVLGQQPADTGDDRLRPALQPNSRVARAVFAGARDARISITSSHQSMLSRS
jgi:hypothetical protein